MHNFCSNNQKPLVLSFHEYRSIQVKSGILNQVVVCKETVIAISSFELKTVGCWLRYVFKLRISGVGSAKWASNLDTLLHMGTQDDH